MFFEKIKQNHIQEHGLILRARKTEGN